jgi:hypothetical protein
MLIMHKRKRYMKERLAEFIFLFWRHYHIEFAITSIVVDLDAYKVFK